MQKIVFFAILGFMTCDLACPYNQTTARTVRPTTARRTAAPQPQQSKGDRAIDEAIRVTGLPESAPLYLKLAEFKLVKDNGMLSAQLPAVLSALSRWRPAHWGKILFNQDVMVFEYAIRMKVKEITDAHKVLAAKAFLAKTADRSQLTLTNHLNYRKQAKPASARKEDVVRTPSSVNASSITADLSSRGSGSTTPHSRSSSPRSQPESFSPDPVVPRLVLPVSPVRPTRSSPRSDKSRASEADLPSHVSPVPFSRYISPRSSVSSAQSSPRTSLRDVALALTNVPVVSPRRPSPRTSRFPAQMPRIMHHETPLSGSSADWFATELAPRQPQATVPSQRPARSPRVAPTASPRSPRTSPRPARRSPAPVDDENVLLEFGSDIFSELTGREPKRTVAPSSTPHTGPSTLKLVAKDARKLWRIATGKKSFTPGNPFNI